MVNGYRAVFGVRVWDRVRISVRINGKGYRLKTGVAFRGGGGV